MSVARGLRRLDGDGWAALVLLGFCAVFLFDLLNSQATGAYVTSVTMPIAIVVLMASMALVLLVGSVLRTGRTAPKPRAESPSGRGLNWRVPAMVLWLVAYTAALPWVGYLLASGVFLVGAGMLYGNRRWTVLLASAVVLPGLLLLFFEKVMIVLLPAARLWN
ncbi:tripartite tricarboxylate transporter TctB family protein [Frigidibacter sp. ROC022]|uniref:tripartite tricarboxylate transporter TctB family protein n=1 Tax=Frigidibacter sp. ROC022 TaxID=2971796 RepID=UPI00215AD310|nr:tripartite tricarboxylate transporter TctB family protein [Frigidibacter sp. ROC022]MCR8723170.1 tripartite tricarboxylate transporter TctB family protein [Frigidibacter sp. ROC022]